MPGSKAPASASRPRIKALKQSTSLTEGLDLLFKGHRLPSLLSRWTQAALAQSLPLALPQNGIRYAELLLLPTLVKREFEIPLLLDIFVRHVDHLPAPLAAKLFHNVLAALLRFNDFRLALSLLNWFALSQEAQVLRFKRDANAWAQLFVVLQATPFHRRSAIRPLFNIAVDSYCRFHGCSQQEADLRNVRRPKDSTLRVLAVRPDLLTPASVRQICQLTQSWNDARVLPRADYQPSPAICAAFLEVFSRVGDSEATLLWMERYLAASSRPLSAQSALSCLLSFQSSPQEAQVLAASWAKDKSATTEVRALAILWMHAFSTHHDTNWSKVLSSLPLATTTAITPAYWARLLSIFMEHQLAQKGAEAALRIWHAFMSSNLDIQLGSSNVAILCWALIQLGRWDDAAAAVAYYGQPAHAWSNYLVQSASAHEHLIPIAWKGRPPPHCYERSTAADYQSVPVDIRVFNVLLEGLLLHRRYEDFFTLFTAFERLEAEARYPEALPDDKTLMLLLDAAYHASASSSTMSSRIAWDGQKPAESVVELMWHLIQEQQALDPGSSPTLDKIKIVSQSQSVERAVQPSFDVAMPLRRKHFRLFVRLLSLRGHPSAIFETLKAWRLLGLAHDAPTRDDYSAVKEALAFAGGSTAEQTRTLDRWATLLPSEGEEAEKGMGISQKPQRRERTGT